MPMKTLLLSIALCLLVPAAVAAQEAPPEADGAQGYEREGTMGAGVQLTWPTYGFSFMLDLSEQLSVQAVVGAGFGFLVSGRGLFRFSPQELFIPYAYGEVGTRTGFQGFGRLNFGAGGGIEADPRRILEDMEDLPPVYVSLEVGLNVTTFGAGTTGTRTRLQAGPALHYRF